MKLSSEQFSSLLKRFENEITDAFQSAQADVVAVKRLEDYDALQTKLHNLEGIDKVADFAHENIKNMQENIDALQDELASARETIEVLSDNALVKGIAQGVKDVEAGNTIKLEDLEENLLVAGAYLAAAEFVEANAPYVQGIGSVGVPMAEHIRKMTAADAERSLQVYAQERVLEEHMRCCETCALALRLSNPEEKFCARGTELRQAARLAELKK